MVATVPPSPRSQVSAFIELVKMLATVCEQYGFSLKIMQPKYGLCLAPQCNGERGDGGDVNLGCWKVV